VVQATSAITTTIWIMGPSGSGSRGLASYYARTGPLR